MLPAARTPRRQHRCKKAPLKLAFWTLALDRSESCHFDDCADAPDKSAPHSSACWNEQSWRLAAENVACPNRDSLKFPLRKSQPCRSSSSPFTPWKFRLGKDVCPPFNCRMSSSAVVGGGPPPSERSAQGIQLLSARSLQQLVSLSQEPINRAIDHFIENK